MRKPAVDDLKLWHITVGVQYLVFGVLVLVGVAFDHYFRQDMDYVLLFMGAFFFLLTSLAAIVSSLSEKSVTGTLIAAAPFYLPFVFNHLMTSI